MENTNFQHVIERVQSAGKSLKTIYWTIIFQIINGFVYGFTVGFTSTYNPQESIEDTLKYIQVVRVIFGIIEIVLFSIMLSNLKATANNLINCTDNSYYKTSDNRTSVNKEKNTWILLGIIILVYLMFILYASHR